MKKYTIIEVQEVIETRVFTWEVDADSPEDALDRFRNAEGTIIEDHRIGDCDYGPSGAVVQLADDRDSAIAEASRLMVENA